MLKMVCYLVFSETAVGRLSVSFFCSENDRNGCEMESDEVAVLN